MPMVRGSSMMSLGTWTRRSTKYQRFLNLSNVFLLIVSTGLLFSSIVLMSFYHMTKVGETVRVFAVAVTQLSHIKRHTSHPCSIVNFITGLPSSLTSIFSAIFLVLVFLRRPHVHAGPRPLHICRVCLRIPHLHEGVQVWLSSEYC